MSSKPFVFYASVLVALTKRCGARPPCLADNHPHRPVAYGRGGRDRRLCFFVAGVGSGRQEEHAAGKLAPAAIDNVRTDRARAL